MKEQQKEGRETNAAFQIPHGSHIHLVPLALWSVGR